MIKDRKNAIIMKNGNKISNMMELLRMLCLERLITVVAVIRQLKPLIIKQNFGEIKFYVCFLWIFCK